LFEFFRVIFTHFTSLFRPQGSKYLVDIYPDIGGYITNLLTNGEALTRVMSLVGHKRLSTTDRYNRLSGVDIKGASSKLGYEIPDDPLGKVIRLA